MSGTSFTYQSDGSIAGNDLSQNDSKNIINKEIKILDSQNKTIYNLNKNIGIDIIKDRQPHQRDNFKINFVNLNTENRNSLRNNHLFNDSDNSVDRQCNDMPESEKNAHIISGEHSNVTSNLEKSIRIKHLNSDSAENVKFVNSSSEETDETEMRAAFSKVAEHFGLSSPKSGSEGSQTFYAVYIPSDSNIKSSDEETLHVYMDKAEALKVMKQSKKARLKQFKTKKEAVFFVVHGSENPIQTNSLQCVSGGEKVMPFKCPKVQDMISFKKAIESGDVEEVRRKIYDNPRYLVSSGDTPSILQEGSRYNALHIAAKSKNVEMAKLILDSITNVEFISYLYDDYDVNSCLERIDVLLDMYLNMPDKGLNETPLHIAVKHGALDVVEYLISYPQCQRNFINKFHQQPKDIICSRVNNPNESVKEAISALLEDQYYIPVLRYEDNTIQPRVGDAFSPSKPLNLSQDLLSPRIEVHAYAGPMNKESAELFKKKWKSPTKSLKNLLQPSSLRLQDMEKGLERIGRNLAQELQVPWKEYWPFLDSFINLSSEEGLQMLESYLKRRFDETLDSVNNSGNMESGEKVVSPITALCESMRFCSLNDESTTPAKKLKWSSWNSEKHDCHKKNEEVIESDMKNPLLYVERSCEVFGKRIASAITSSSDLYGMHAECMKDSLEIQVKHLTSSILSYREDNRFQCVNFQMIHSRVASVAINSLVDFTSRDRGIILNSLKDIDWSDGTLSDDEDLTCNYRNLSQELIGNSVKQHLHCLVKSLINELNSKQESETATNTTTTTTARNEADCSRLWSMAVPCCCSWNLNTYFRPRIGVKRKSSKYMNRNNNLDCDIRSAFQRALAEEIAEDEKTATVAKTDEEEVEEEEEVFGTPPSSLTESEEEESMEDPLELPDTFIYEGSVPSKIDYAVLDAIQSAKVSSDKYPNICRWKHLVTLHSKTKTPLSNSTATSRINIPSSAQKKRIPALSSPNSSPGKVLNRSFGSCDITRRSASVEPWERILGPYSPCTPKKASSLTFANFDSPIKR